MAKGTIGGKIVLEGEKQYREALKAIKSEQAELRSEMKLCQTQFKNSQNSIEALQKKHEILTKQIDSQTQKVQTYQKAMETSSQKEEQAAKKVQELQTALSKAEQEFAEMSQSSDTTKEALDSQGAAVDELRKKLQTAESDYDKAAQKTQSYQTSLNYAEAELKGMEGELSTTEKYLREAENSTDGCAQSIDEFGQETQEAAKETSVFGDVLKANLASEAIIKGVKMLADGIKKCAEASMEVGSEFEASMSQVAATMGMTAEEINNGSEEYEKLAQAAKNCGATTKYSASEAGEALNYLALAGYDADKSISTLPKVLDLAAAGGLDLAYASDLVTDSMAALGLETNQLDLYIDEMAKTSQKSNTSVAQLGEATLVCAGTVSLTQQKLETMNAELGILANNGIKGAEGGTHLRNILLSLSAPTDTASVAIKQLNLDIADSQGNMRDLNDIMIDLNAAMEGMSSTEKTQMIKKIFNKTDIAAVNALLKGTNGEFDNLMTELEGCSGAAKAMADTMNNNLKGKLTILQSSLEGLGIAAYEVFDDDMKTAVEGATKAVGRLQNSIEQGSLGVSLNKLSDALGEFCENAVDVGEDALPVVIDGLTWLLDNSDAVIAGVTGIAAANLEMKVVGPAIESLTAAWNTYKLANEGATVSQWALNAAMTANPAGLLIGAVVGLTAAVGAYIIMNKDELTAMDETSEKTKELVEETKSLNAEYARTAEERAKTKAGMEAEASQAKKLVDELTQLANKTSKTKDEQTRMKMIVEQLNQIVPELNLAIDDQTGKLNMSTDAIELNIDAMMALARAEAAREDLTRIAEEQYEAEKQLTELREQEAEQAKVLEQANANLAAEYEKFEGAQGNAWRSFNTSLVTAQQNAQNTYDSIQAEIEETEGTINGLGEEYATTMQYISDQEDMAEASVEELGDAAVGAAADMQDMSSTVSEAWAEMYDNLSETVSKQIDLFSQFSSEAELSSQELLANMQSQVDGISQWADNLEALAERGIDQGLLQHLADMGPEGAAYVSTFVSMTDEELQKAGELYAEAMSLPDETASKIADSWEKAGENAAQGYIDGVDGKKEEAAEKSGEVGQESLDELEEVLDEHSPSKETEKMGEFFVDGFKEGIETEKQPLIDTVSNMASSVLQTLEREASKDKAREIGKQIPAGLAEGIKAGESAAINAAAEMAKKALAAAKKELDVHSPSKKFAYLGEMSGEGYIEGWRESMADVDAVIAESLPDTAMLAKKAKTAPVGVPVPETEAAGKTYNIEQTINIYDQTNDLVETTREFRRAQKEAAEQW